MNANCENSIHPDLLEVEKAVYELSGLKISELKKEAESDEYGAFEFKLNGLICCKFRAAKITPTKVGQFVTLWKRIGRGPIIPFDEADPIDFFLVSVRRGLSFGQFVFPKSALVAQDIVSKEGIGGKRAIRVYPPWDVAESRQAEKTQKWQSAYFLPIHPDASDTCHLTRKLFRDFL